MASKTSLKLIHGTNLVIGNLTLCLHCAPEIQARQVIVFTLRVFTITHRLYSHNNFQKKKRKKFGL